MKGLVVTGVVVGVVAVLGMVGCGATVGTYNTLVQQEEGIKAQYKQNQNNYDNMWKTFREMAQVPAMYAADLEKIYGGAIQGRYGKDGSRAVFQFIQEHNPQVDASLYTRLQQAIEAGRKSFEVNQTTLLDKKRVYETNLRVFPSSLVASLMGFPKIDLTKYDIVTSGETEKAFESKRADEVKLR